MKTTVNAVLININPEQEVILNHLQTLFSSAVRFAYQRLPEGVVKKDIQKLIQEKYGLNSRYASDAIEQARQLKDQWAQLPPNGLGLYPDQSNLSSRNNS